ncbi:threonine synthase [Falsiroseomonas oryzae]|uniref:threonine synthase n=1 Tax=Falsiroseomonas oryzae TaxID=2766473 RepID=UPI0022EB41AC|nr:pyridoxal-phosphate dependent enzyme [Roseomonas sp. MO-31]
MQWPLGIGYDLARVDPALFDQAPGPGLDRWQPLLPPLAPGLSMGEGGTPLIDAPAMAEWLGLPRDALLLKDESRNPTHSHKDRLNLCTVSAALAVGAPGICVASSGNHGLAAAAYAARAGLPAVVVTGAGGQPAFRAWWRALGAEVLTVAPEQRWPLLNRIVAETGFHPVSNLTRFHTGHPFGPEGYKTIAYELFLQLGRAAPAMVVVPTGYGEMLYGIHKGFQELRALGLLDRTPRIVSAEPAVRGPLARALAGNLPAVEVAPAPGRAAGIMCTVNSWRGVVAVRDSGGLGLTAREESIAEARTRLATSGSWQEYSGVAGLAALREALADGRLAAPADGPVVVLLTSAGIKDIQAEDLAPLAPDTPAAIEATLARLREGRAA